MNPPRLVPERQHGPDGAGQGPRNGGPPDDEEEEDEGSRRRANIMLGLAVVVVTAIGIWLVNALLEQRRIDNCMAQGRRNCGQVEVPSR